MDSSTAWYKERSISMVEKVLSDKARQLRGPAMGLLKTLAMMLFVELSFVDVAKVTILWRLSFQNT